MRYYCIFEINNKTKETTFVDNFDESIEEAREMCMALNNFSSSDYHYCLRCLDSFEFQRKEKYNPIFTKIVV